MAWDPEPTVSIIVPALDEATHLPDLLAAIDHLEYPKAKLEVIVVDNGSRDRTREIASSWGAAVLEHPELNVGGLRNRGAERASGRVLAFIDADCIPSPAWLRAALARLREPSVVGVGCHTRIPEGASWVERVIDFHALPRNAGDVDFLPTANLIVEHDAFDACQGFDEELGAGEDSDLSDRLRGSGGRLISDPAIHVVHSDYPKSLAAVYRRELWHSSDLLRLLRRSRFRSDYVLGVAAPVVQLLLFLCAAALAIGGVAAREPTWLICAATSALVLPAFLALRKARDKGSLAMFPQSTVFYAVILVARIAAGLRSVVGSGSFHARP